MTKRYDYDSQCDIDIDNQCALYVSHYIVI